MNLPLVDLAIIAVSIIAIVIFGSSFVRKNRSSTDFMVAKNFAPGWVIGLSYLGTYLSSNTFIGVVGMSFGMNWNYFVFSLAIPIAILICSKYFIPFYRNGGEISAYTHMEKRFGVWARIYCVVCYLLIQFSRIATITLGVAIALNGLTGWSMASIIIVSGVLITSYTVMGGMKALIWTEAIQTAIIFLGAVLLLVVILVDIPGGADNAFKIAIENSKFSLGSFKLSFSESTFWVVFLYGLFMNIKAFGFDQTYVQRYHTAKSDKEARKSLWFGGMLYVPVSALFFFIGTMLFSYYQAQPELLNDLKHKSVIASMKGQVTVDEGTTFDTMVNEKMTSLTIPDVADQALPHFMGSGKLPVGAAGFIIAAIIAAAMSTLSVCLNSSSTVFYEDIYKRYLRPKATDKEGLAVLRIATVLVGAIGTGFALSMVGIQSILAAWWQLTGIFGGAMLGLFLLGFIVKNADKATAIISVVVGVLVILWITLSPKLPEYLQSPFHTYMSVVISTLTMFLVGLAVSQFKNMKILK
ncbi:MAG: sodium:solute symporter [Parabacteroides sp.]|nr:sodium:solute symporter [Parabacteroides sp.]